MRRQLLGISLISPISSKLIIPEFLRPQSSDSFRTQLVYQRMNDFRLGQAPLCNMQASASSCGMMPPCSLGLLPAVMTQLRTQCAPPHSPMHHVAHVPVL